MSRSIGSGMNPKFADVMAQKIPDLLDIADWND